MKTYFLRYDLQGADEAGYRDHPQVVMQYLGRELGFIKIADEAVPIGSCWMNWVISEKDIIFPEFITVLDYISYEDWRNMGRKANKRRDRHA